jgi:hypothetical protein
MYDSCNLSALTYANGFSLWSYKTRDRAYDVTLPGYFSPAGGELRGGDFVFLNANINGAVESCALVVTCNSGGQVKVGPLTPVTTADPASEPAAA